MKLSYLLTVSATVLPCAVFAATPVDSETAIKLSDTVITANRTAQEKTQTTATLTVFTREDIERLNPSSISDLLGRVPGVQIQQTGGRGSVTGIFIRGTKTAQSIVLIDGIRVGSASTGGASLQHLSLEQIERVEVLRGSRSSVYGADAIGGVIQIFTRRTPTTGVHGRVRLAAGNKGTYERSVGFSAASQATQFTLNASLNESRNLNRTQRSYPSDSDHDAYRNKGLSLNLTHAFNDQVKAGLSVLEQRGKSEYDNPYGYWDPSTYQSFPARPYDDFQINAASAYLQAQVVEQWLSRIEFGHSEDKLISYDKLHPTRSSFNTYRDSITWLNMIDLHAHQLLTGAEFIKDKLRSTAEFNKTDRWNQAAFLQHRFEGQRFSTELGWRHDKNQQFGYETTWSGAISIPFTSAHSFTLSYAEGFRSPTFNDLYWAFDGMTRGNPDLKPERSKSYELKWHSQISDNLIFESSLYRTTIRSLLTYVSNPVTWVGQVENLDKARINGFEASLKHNIGETQGALNLSMIDPRDARSGHTLNFRAKRTLSYDLDKPFGAFNLGATWRIQSKSFNDALNQEPIAGFGTVDLRGNWHTTDALDLSLRISNLFDKKYSRALYRYEGRTYGYREERSSILFAVTWTPIL